MGHSFNEPAWSWSRQRLFHRCPRAFYYNYYPWGDVNQGVVSFLKRAKSVPLVVGDIAHDFIAIALKQFKSHGKWVDVAPSALRRFDDVVRESARLAESSRAARRPASEGTVLLHHLNHEPSKVQENAGKENLAEVLANFGSKEIRSNLGDPAKWYPVMGGIERKPYVNASKKLGFKRTGFKVYTAYDFATKPAFDCIIVDWKTGAVGDGARSRS